MNESRSHLAVLILASLVAGVAVWAVLHYTAPKLRGLRHSTDYLPNLTPTEADLWNRGVEKVKEDRGESAGNQPAIDVPPELRHYSDTHWFLATQVAEVKKNNVRNVQDFLDLATMIQRGELVAVPAATEDYILLGVGAKADDGAFTRYEDDHSIGLYNEAQLRDEYARLDAARSNVQGEIKALKAQMGSLKKRDRQKQAELQKEMTARQQELKSTEDDKALLDRFYGQPESRQKLFGDYQTLRALAGNFRGRSYNLEDTSDRQALKVTLLRSLRPEALKVLEIVAAAYHQRFERPLPVSSLVRPEEYQHDLHKINRNAILIDTPPHSTGLAFDIDYRYMSAEEQNFLMSELARMKDEGRIEVLRERNANYHVFAFINGTRPNDELIAASLDEAQASPPAKEAHHATKKNAEKEKSKARRAKHPSAKAKARNGKLKAKRRR